MKDKHSGSCLCGAVRFEVDGDFEQFYLCHCEYCRKDTGSAHGANLFSSSATLQWISGEDKVRQFDLPGTRHSKGFCSICGSALPKIQMNGQLVVVPAGSLNTEVRIRPDAHIFVSSRAGWDHELERVPSVERLPSVTQSPEQVLFVHGAGDGAHAADAKLVASLREQLGPGYGVRYPLMPNESDPDCVTWKQCIADELAIVGDNALLVGHSIGASVLIKFLADGGVKQSIAGVFLIAAPFWHDHEVWRWKEAELPKDAADRLPRGLPVFLYHGREDETVPFSHLAMYAKLLPHATLRALDDRNHQVNDDLTEVAHDIKRVSAKMRG